jgi:integrase
MRRKRRRANLPAGVYDLDDRGLSIRYTGVPHPDGSRYQPLERLVEVFDPKKAAEIRRDRIKDVKIQLGNGADLRTLNDLWVAFQASAKAAKLAPSTMKHYELHMTFQVRRLLGDPRLADLTRPAVHTFLDRLAKEGNVRTGKGLKPKSIRNVHGFLHRLLKWGIPEYLDSNPSDGWELPEWIPELYGRALSEAGLRDLMDAAPDRETKVIIETVGTCGLRNGEVRALRTHDAYLAALTFDVWDQRADAERAVRRPKNGKPRQVPIPSFLAEDLAAYIAWRDARAAAFGPPYQSDLDLLFPAEDGGYLTGKVVLGRVQKSARAAKIGHLTMQDLRRTAASFADDAADNEGEQAAGRMSIGHASRRVNERFYQRRPDRPPRLTSAQRKLAEHLDALLRPALRDA